MEDIETNKESVLLEELLKNKQVIDSKIISNFELQELLGQLATSQAENKTNRKKNQAPLEERKSKRQNISFSILDNCIFQKLLLFAGFTITLLEEQSTIQRNQSLFSLNLKLMNNSNFNQHEHYSKEEIQILLLENTSSVNSLKVKTKVEYIPAFKLLVNMICPQHMFHEKSLFFWSAFIQTYVSKLQPVQLLT